MAESVPGQIVVKFSSETPLWRRNLLCRSIQGTEVPSSGQDDSYVLAVPVGTEVTAIVLLGNSPDVLYAEPVYIDRVVIPKTP